MAVNGASIVRDNSQATDNIAPLCDVVAPSRGLWFRVVGTGTTLTATTCLPGADFDTSLQVFCNCETLGCVADNDDDVACGLGGTRSTVSWCSDPNQIYYVHVGGSGAGAGEFEIQITDDATTCLPSPACAPEIGACCVGEALAANDTRLACDTLGGDWYIGEICDTFACPAIGACCVGGVCQETNTQNQCNALGGTWTNGEDCATFVCLPPAPRTEGPTSPHEDPGAAIGPKMNATNASDDINRPLHRIHDLR